MNTFIGLALIEKLMLQKEKKKPETIACGKHLAMMVDGIRVSTRG